MVRRLVCIQRTRNEGLCMPDMESHWLAERLAYLGRSLTGDAVWRRKASRTFPRLQSDPKAEGLRFKPCYPYCPQRKIFASHQILVQRSCPTIWAGDQLETRATAPGGTSERVPPFVHHHWRDRVEDCQSAGLHHHVRYQDRQRSRQNACKGEQCIWQTI